MAIYMRWSQTVTGGAKHKYSLCPHLLVASFISALPKCENGVGEGHQETVMFGGNDSGLQKELQR